MQRKNEKMRKKEKKAEGRREEKERESISKKKGLVDQLTAKCKSKKTIAISSIERIPAQTFKKIRAELKKSNAEVKVVKSSIAKKVLQNLGISGLDSFLQKPIAFIISDIDPFSLASLLEELKVASYVKPGMKLDKDLVIEPCVTDLPPTAVVELSKCFKVGVEKGKVAIKERKVIRANEVIDANLANALQKLEIKPLRIGLNVDVAIDLQSGKIYKNIVINKQEELERLKLASSRAFNLALSINYPCKQTIRALLQKAFVQAKNLNLKTEQK
jgi:large subunit ribosomal protein L10